MSLPFPELCADDHQMTSPLAAAGDPGVMPWRSSFELTAADGSVIHVREWGDPRGPLVISHHGTPSSSAAVPGGWDAIATSGVRLCSFDRPGYGGSTRQVGRTVADAAHWSASIADHLGVDRFASVGTSGGGPHAAAVAALYPERVSALGIVVGLAPAESGFDPATDMLSETVDEIVASRAGEKALRAYIEGLGPTDSALDEWLTRFPASDREVASRPDVQREEELEGTEWPAQDVDGWVDDDLALFEQDWGFRAGQIVAQTELLFGDADIFVPPSHANQWSRLLPAARLTWVPDGGHYARDHEISLLHRLVGFA